MRSRFWLVGAVSVLVACGGGAVPTPSGTGTPADVPDPNSGGAMTVNDATSGAFGLPAPNLSAAKLAQHVVGDAAFGAVFVPAPAPVNPGLGPRFDNNACASCHVNDGRGRPPTAGEAFNSMLFRISSAGTAADGGPVAVPMHGTQLRTRAIVGLSVPTASVTYTDSAGTFADGTTYSLRVPQYTVSDPFVPLPSDVLVSPRVAPVNFGLGLLEAIPEATVLALVSSSDAVAAGVSGRPNYVWDVVAQKQALGRFGLKANVPNILQQVAAAYQGDMGVTNSLFPNEPCEDAIPGCALHAPDLSDSLLQATSAYIHTLGVPVRRDVNSTTVVRGQQLFQTLGCSGCHVATVTTGSVAAAPEASNQKIHPYTDLLLHDMGAALADNRPDYQAGGSEWRTPPLWGIGLTAIVNGHTNFLHDGRARSLLEAVMWHGGEAQRQREAVRALAKADRDALVAFLQSL